MELNIRELPLQERSRQRVEMVVEATKTILQESGYSELTLSAVCEQAKIKQTSIYRYWPNKQALLATMAQQFEQDYTVLTSHLTARATEIPWQDLLKENMGMIRNYVDENKWFLEGQKAIKTEKVLLTRYREMISYFTVQYTHILKLAGMNCDIGKEASVARSTVLLLDMFLMEMGRNFENEAFVAALEEETLIILTRYLDPYMV